MPLTDVLTQLYRLKPKGMHLGLERVHKASVLLGDPWRDFSSVQIAGTNGKGTVASLLSHAVSRTGIRVGLFTSPHLHRFAERIRVNGIEIDGSTLERHLTKVLALNDTHKDLGLTFFEVATLAACTVFREQKVDVAVFEVGLGGRLDATSIVAPDFTAITSIGMDHTAILGNSLEKIAGEKAAITRDGVPVVVGALPDEALGVVERVAASTGAPMRLIGRDFSPDLPVKLPWTGAHQIHNAALAFELFQMIGNRFSQLTTACFADSLDTYTWPGRFERLEMNPPFVLDCAHNVEAVRALMETLRSSAVGPDVMIFGALRDKPVTEMLGLLRSLVKKCVLMSPPIERALNPREYAVSEDIVCDSTIAAIQTAKELAGQSSVLVTGSVFTVGAVRTELLNEPSDPPIGL